MRWLTCASPQSTDHSKILTSSCSSWRSFLRNEKKYPRLEQALRDKRGVNPVLRRRQEQSDRRYMRMACRLAEKAAGRTSPNPMVGAVLVRDGKMIASGYHQFAGA